jgi:biopolymer transport protein ExbD
MASMTDIVFLLLIFFLITSTLVNPNALRLLLPRSNSQTPSKAKASVFIKHLGDKNFEYYVETKPVKFDEIERNLQLKLMNAEEPTISLYADRTVPVEEVVRIMNIASRNKYKMILATAPE